MTQQTRRDFLKTSLRYGTALWLTAHA